VGVAADHTGQGLGAAVELDLEDEPSGSVRAHRSSLAVRHDICIGRDRLIFSQW
jgi:hypothetical protein